MHDKKPILARWIGILRTYVIVASVLNGAVSAEEGVVTKDTDQDPVISTLFDFFLAPFVSFFTAKASYGASGDPSQTLTGSLNANPSDESTPKYDREESIFNLTERIDDYFEDCEFPFLFESNEFGLAERR